MQLNLTKSQRLYLTLVVLSVLGLSFWASLPLILEGFDKFEYIYPYKKGVNFNTSYELGSEYYNIAQALVSERGFSDPFAVPTGPTAWMPPLLPTILAFLTKSLGKRENVVFAAIALQDLTLMMALGALVLLPCRKRSAKLDFVALIWGLGWLLFNFCWFFQTSHDVWLLMLLTTLMLLEMSLIFDKPAVGGWARWGVLGGFIAIASPTLTFAWVCCSILMATKTHNWRRCVQSLFIPFMVISIWTTRNYVVLGRFIPIKSNALFELYFANARGGSGVYTNTQFADHPVTVAENNPNQFFDKFGHNESEIIDRAANAFVSYLSTNPADYIQKVSTRALAALFIYHPFILFLEREVSLWTYIFYAIPGLCALILTMRLKSLSSFQQACLLLYAAYLTPYIVTAFYIRYLLPLTPVLLLFVRWTSQEIVNRYMKEPVARSALTL